MEEQTQTFEKKEIKYRGKSLAELKEMDLREFAKLLKSNERRTILRQSDSIQRFILRCMKKTEKKKPIRTHLRDLVIVPKLVGLKINVYNGKEFTPMETTIEMLGHRLGEFSVTRNKVKHGAAGIGATRSSASKSVK
ncbi:MAG: 30S ribosomal protein S19 [Candidatus Pacearchaeota archaeon]